MFNEREDEEVRVWSITGLATILSWSELTNEQQRGIFKIIENKCEELTVKDSCLRGVLNMSGVTSSEMFLKTFDESNTELQSIFDKKRLIFLKELNEIRPDF